MRAPALAAAGLVALLALPASAAGTAGPFVGTVAQGRTNTHHYDNNPSGNPCIDIVATYTITVVYAPVSDALTVSAVTSSATGSNGTATINVTQGVCAAFPITVTGTSVASSATYAVTVTRQLLGPISLT